MHRRFWTSSFCTLCPILQQFAPFARFETVQKPCTHGLQNKKAMKSFDFTASTVDIPTRWNPRAKQQPTGLIACGAMRRRPVRVPSIAPRKTSTQCVLVFLGASSDTELFKNHRSTICFLRSSDSNLLVSHPRWAAVLKKQLPFIYHTT